MPSKGQQSVLQPPREPLRHTGGLAARPLPGKSPPKPCSKSPYMTSSALYPRWLSCRCSSAHCCVECPNCKTGSRHVWVSITSSIKLWVHLGLILSQPGLQWCHYNNCGDAPAGQQGPDSAKQVTAVNGASHSIWAASIEGCLMLNCQACTLSAQMNPRSSTAPCVSHTRPTTALAALQDVACVGGSQACTRQGIAIC